MTFQPEVNQELIIDGTSFRVAEHPAAHGMPYGQEGRQATVYCLEASSGNRRAIKAFKPRFRVPSMVSLAKRLAFFADLPGLAVCRRTVLTPQHHANLLREFPDLLYGVVMPWVDGPTWMETVLERRELSPEQSLGLARSLAIVLASMEQEGLAHCDLSGPNILLPMLAPSYTGGHDEQGVALVDVEQMYGPDLKKPEVVPGGSPGYAHKMAPEGMWETDADRLAGAVVLAEMLAWWDPEVRTASWGESYFDPTEMQQASRRADVLYASLRREWGEGVVQVFDRAWHSETLAECPTFGEWLVVLPEAVGAATSRYAVAAVPSPAELKAAIEAADAGPVDPIVRELMDQAEASQTEGDLGGALALYKEARSLSVEGSKLSKQLNLIIEDIDRKQRGEPAPAVPSAAPAPPVEEAAPAPVEATPEEEGTIDPIVSILMSQASDFEEEGRLEPALQSYREALSLVPVRSRLGNELPLIIRDLEQRLASQEPAAPVAEVAPPVEAPAPAPEPVAEAPLWTVPLQPEPEPAPPVVEQAPELPAYRPPEPVVTAPLPVEPAPETAPSVAPIVADLMEQARQLEQGGDLKEALATYREARSLAPQNSSSSRELDGLIAGLEARLAAPPPVQAAPDLSELLASAAPAAFEPAEPEVVTRELEERYVEPPPPPPVELPSYKPEEPPATVPLQFEPEREPEPQPQLPSFRPGVETPPPPPPGGPVLPTFKPDGDVAAPAAMAAASGSASSAQIDPIVWQLMDEARGLDTSGQPQRALAMYREARSLVPEGSEFAREISQKVHDLEERLRVGPRVVGPLPRESGPQPEFAPPQAPPSGFDLGAALAQAPETTAPLYTGPQGQPPAGQAAYPAQPGGAGSGVGGGFLDTYYDMGLSAYNRGDWAQASQLLGEVVKRQPEYRRDGQLASDLLVEVERQKSGGGARKGKKEKEKPKDKGKPAKPVATTAAPVGGPAMAASTAGAATAAPTASATAAAAVPATVPATTDGAVTAEARPAKPKPRTTQQQAGRNWLIPAGIGAVVLILLLVVGGFFVLSSGNKGTNSPKATPTTQAQVTKSNLASLETTATAVAVAAASTRQAAFAAATKTVFAAESTATAAAGAFANGVKAMTLERTLEGTKQDVRTVAFSPDGTMLAAGSYDQTVVLWKVSDWSISKVLTGPVNSVINLAFSRDGKMVAAADDGGKIWIWDLASGKSRFLDHGGRAWSVAFSPDSTALISGSGLEGANIKIWSASDGKLLHDIALPKYPDANGKGNYTRGIAFSPDGSSFATGSEDKAVRVWQSASASTTLTLTGHTGAVYTVSFSPDGKVLASGSQDSSVRLWKMPEGSPLLTLKNHQSSVTSVSFSPDGKLLAGGSADTTITIWAVGDGSLLTTLKEPTNKTTSVAFSPDGKLLASGSGSGADPPDGKVRIWSVPPK